MFLLVPLTTEIIDVDWEEQRNENNGGQADKHRIIVGTTAFSLKFVLIKQETTEVSSILAYSRTSQNTSYMDPASQQPHTLSTFDQTRCSYSTTRITWSGINL